MIPHELLADLGERLGTAPPTDEERETLLAMAGVAAHASERWAAPLACWMAGRAGVMPAEAAAVVREITEEGARSEQ
ncbi:MAG: DUF6457 domain-containing protein [Solirubrobacteraceae bacterium MAG38_C4-C5]|nr:DUF6457 domain-containing protein [Candidatus Siliceabacter maunaloa]